MAMPPEAGSAVSRWTFAPVGILALTDSPRATRSTSSPAPPVTSRTRWGLPMSTARARVTAPPAHSGASPSTRADPIATDRLCVTSSTRSWTVTVRRPASVWMGISSSPARPGHPPSSMAWARQRMPLPLISAGEPSALRNSIRARAGAPGSAGEARSRPSAPTPVCRSHKARATPASMGWEASVSSTTRKSLPNPWCLVRRMSPTVCPTAVEVRHAFALLHPRVLPGDRRHQRRQQRGRVGPRLQPVDAGVAPEPRPLPAGEAPGAPDRQLERVVEGRLPLEVGDELAVAERLAGGSRQAPGVVDQPADLVEEAVRHLPVVPRRDAGGDDLVGQADTDEAEAAGRVRVQPRPERRERAAGAQGDLQGPHHPAPVGRLHARGGHRIEVGEPAVERLRVGLR